MKKNVKLVVCDIDNTLVIKRQPLTERARNAILELQKHGVYFGLASGRGVHHLKSLAEQWGIECQLYIGMNGAEICDELTGQHEVLYRMKAEWVKEAFEIMSPFKSWPHALFGEVMYARPGDPSVASSNAYVKNQNPPHIVQSDDEFWHADSIKIGFRVSAEDMPDIEAAVAKKTNPDYIGFKTETTMFEFGNALAQKGTLLKKFYETHQIPREAVWSFGDMTNDITLFDESGVAVCMINGSDDAKAHADIITDLPCTEDGWADYVEKYILPFLD
ncbi:MAG: HAD family phosphatase [Erysipelotrichaceae bacterium]|nr:HAD family phosphatase [Erysipelotrichaceae bacterium]